MPNKSETIPKLDDIIARLVHDLHLGVTAPGANDPAKLAQFSAAIESLINARLRLPLDTFGP